MDHRFLNYEVAELKGQIPTCAKCCPRHMESVGRQNSSGHLHRVRLYEISDLFADCYRNGAKELPMSETLPHRARTTLSHFAASHRYTAQSFLSKKTTASSGKANNPYGHGHKTRWKFVSPASRSATA